MNSFHFNPSSPVVFLFTPVFNEGRIPVILSTESDLTDEHELITNE